MKVHNVSLRNFNLKKAEQFRVNKGIDCKWYQDEQLAQNQEVHASLIAQTKSEINNQLAVLNNSIMSDRLRSVRGVPKCRVILQAHPKRKLEMKQEIQEYF